MTQWDARQRRLLEGMGITLWQPREPAAATPAPAAIPNSVAPPPKGHRLWVMGRSCVGPAAELLDAMLAAIDQQLGESAVMVESLDQAVSEQLATPLAIWQLSDDQALTQALKAAQPDALIIASPHPNAVLEDKKLKPRVWQDLKALQRILQATA